MPSEDPVDMAAAFIERLPRGVRRRLRGLANVLIAAVFIVGAVALVLGVFGGIPMALVTLYGAWHLGHHGMVSIVAAFGLVVGAFLVYVLAVGLARRAWRVVSKWD